MPWYIIIYVCVFFLFGFAMSCNTFRLEKKTSEFVRAIYTVVTFTFFFVSFWHPSLRAPLGIVAPILFVLALALELWAMDKGLRMFLGDPEFSASKKCFATGVMLLLYVPAFVVAGIAAFKT